MKKVLLALLFSLALFAQDISGTYKGTLKAETAGGTDGTGYIVVKQTGDTLTVTAGPGPEEQHETIHVDRKGEHLKFEIDRDGDGSRMMKFDLLVKDGKLTGTITMVSENGTNVSLLNLVKQ